MLKLLLLYHYRDDLVLLNKSVRDLEQIVPDLWKLQEVFSQSLTDGPSVIGDTVAFIHKLIVDKSTEFLTWSEFLTSKYIINRPGSETLDDRETKFGMQIENMIETVLLVVQSLSKQKQESDNVEAHAKNAEKHSDIEGNFQNILIYNFL